MWKNDDEIKESILEDDGDIIVSAGAGSGKTTLLIRKMNADLENIKGHYSVAAITFTNKAARELLSRIGKYDYYRNFVGTSDSFIDSEIIKPFLKDAGGREYPSEYIIDYKVKFASFKEGLRKLKYESILGVYDNSKLNTKKNFKFRLALKILHKSLAAKQYLQAKYKRIFIDEYQDTDRDMNSFYLYLTNELNIRLFLVGDLKQSIYEWRGAEPKNFKGLIEENSGFSSYELYDNHRCCKDVQNYANLFTVGYPHPIDVSDNITGVISIRSRNENYTVNTFINTKELDFSKSIAILVKTRKQAEDIIDELREVGYDFTFVPTTPLDSATPNSNFLKELVTYIKDEEYTFFDLRNMFPREINNSDITELKKIITKFRSKAEKDVLENLIIELYGKLGLVHYNDEFNNFFNVVNTNIYDAAFRIKSALHFVMTIHSAKGLEFDQVVVYSKDFQYGNDTSQLHYVAVTRAKEKLIILQNSNVYEQRLKRMMKEKQVKKISQEIIVN